MIKRMLIMLVIISVLFGGIFGYKAFIGHMINKSLSAHQSPSVAVATIKARSEAWEPRIDAVGSVRASQGVEVTTEIAGQVDAVLFQSGEDVKSGQVLVRLKAEADTALLRSLEAEAELARSTFERDKRQFAVKAISQAGLDGAQADLKSRQAQVAQQSAMLEKKTIRAPFGGRIGISTVAPGQYLNPGDRIVTLQAIDSVYVDFFLPQQDIARIAVEQPVTVISNTYPDSPFQGRISAVNPVEKAPKAQLYAAPQHPYTQALLSAVPVPVPGSSGQRRSSP